MEIVLVKRRKKTVDKRHSRTAGRTLRRSKRRWAPIPCSLMENSLGPFPQHVQQVQSDTAQNYTIFYSISGPGVDKEPFNLFYVDKDSGDIFCTRSIDREQYEEFPIYAYATTEDGYAPEYPLLLLFKVEDDNDNAPYFETKMTVFSVPENCRSGTSVGKVTAIDLDEPDTLHTRLKYKILQQIPEHPKHFSVHPDTGVITTLTPFLDREKCDTYQLIMEVRDMGGQPFGLFSTGTITISLEDENDNSPFFTETSYVTEVEENRIDVEILRMMVHDQDLPNTPHSRAVYKILHGNENGNFKISTDPNTNEAVLCVVKALNFEVSKEVVLQIGVLNEAQFSKSSSQTPTMCTATVTVKIKDADEGPECQPPVRVLQSRDGLQVGQTLQGYKAIDPETRSGQGLTYKKIVDEDNWFEIDESTGNLKTVKVLDRESKFVKNDKYNISVLAVDANGKSCTGTLVILLEDFNDHPPQMEKEVTICQNDKDFAVLNPVDPDGPDNGPPFQFILDNSASRLWTIEPRDGGKTAILRQRQILESNFYTVPMQIRDRHGISARHTLTVRVCDCTTPSDCKPRSQARDAPPNVILGRWAILAMVLGSAVLLCILFACFCVTVKKTTKKCFPEDVAQQNLIVSNTEGPGEEVTEANIRLPTQTSNVCDTSTSVGTLGGQGIKTQQSFEMLKGGYTLESNKGGGHQTLESVKGVGQGGMDVGRYTYNEWHSFTQPRLGEKVYLCGQDEEHKHSEDYVRSYNYEGKGSMAGSVGCCSDRQEEEGLEFLDHLEPKFRTLAKTCIRN